jgi:uncharacterized protein YuzE
MKITYFFKEDVAYISLCELKSSIGDEDFQGGVVLYRDSKNKITGIEILKFSNFKESKIILSANESIDFTTTFRELHMLISLRDIMFDDPVQFESTCKEWGIRVQKISSKLNQSPSINVPISPKDIPNLTLTEC